MRDLELIPDRRVESEGGDTIGFLFDPRTWTEQALCATTDPEAFFPEKGGSTREAKAVCSRCDVRTDCLEDALARQERFGIWGGLSERERRKLAGTTRPRKRPRTGPCLDCGRPMRSCNTPAADAPGTVQHAAMGYCSGCYARTHGKVS